MDYVNQDPSVLAYGWVDDQYDTTLGAAPIFTVPHNPSPAPPVSGGWNVSLWNISQGRGSTFGFSAAQPPAATDLHSLTYDSSAPSGSQTSYVMEVQNWFCDEEGFTGYHVYVDNPPECDRGGPYNPTYQNPNIASGQMFVDVNDGHAYVGWSGWWHYADDARVVNMWDRGGDIAAFDYNGGPTDCPGPPTDTPPAGYYNVSNYVNSCGKKAGFADAGFLDMVNSIQNTLPTQRPGANMTFFLILDQSAWNNGTPVCGKPMSNGQHGPGQQYEPWCAASKMVADLTYAYAPYLLNANYFKTPSTQLPVIAFFQDESDDFSQCTTATPCYWDSNLDQCNSQSTCFSDVHKTITTWLTNTYGLNKYYRIFAYASGCPLKTGGHPYSDGCYGWLQPNVYGTPAAVIANQNAQGWLINGTTEPAKSKIDAFYNAVGANGGNLGLGANGLTPLVMGAAFKGFDDYEAGWATDRVLTQGCGTTWLNSIAEPKTITGANLSYMMIETWDDYEEGTETETGISNCLGDSSFTLSPIVGNELTFNFDIYNTVDNVTFSTVTSTISSFAVWASTASDPTHYFLAGNSPASICTYSGAGPLVASCTIGLPALWFTTGTSYNLIVQAVGKPMITNHISNNSVTYTLQ